MRVILGNPRFSEAVEQAVARAESRSDAELVVVAASRSGSYRDLAEHWATLLAFLVLVFMVASPWTFHPATLVVGAAAAWLLGRLLLHRSDAALRLLSRRNRRHEQVLEAARAAFVEESVHGTRRRTGLLVYYSELEGEVVLLPDLPLEGRVPPSAWTALDLHPADLDAFLGLLDRLGTLLAEHVPALEDNPDELPNAPRIRS